MCRADKWHFQQVGFHPSNFPLIRTQSFEKLETVHLRHVDVANYDSVAEIATFFGCLLLVQLHGSCTISSLIAFHIVLHLDNLLKCTQVEV